MNKRIKKKVEKRQAAEQAAQQMDVSTAFHKLEEDFVHLAQAVLSEGREKSSAAAASVRETLARSEETLEQLLAKVPGMGPLAEALHKTTHGEEKQGDERASRPH